MLTETSPGTRLDEDVSPEIRCCVSGLFSCGSLFSGGFLGSGSSGSLSGGSGKLGFLLGHGLSLSLILSLFSLKTFFSVKFLLVGHGSAQLVYVLLLLSLPSIKATLGFSLVKRALLHATLKVLHKKYTLVGEDSADGIGGLCTYVKPIQSTLEI